jgi:hypothetical protein
MAKLFYTLQETLAKLGKDESAVNGLVSAGKLREFRDHDNKLLFKREEVDLLITDAAGSGELDLSGVPSGSDSFELDLSDSSVDDRSGTGRSASLGRRRRTRSGPRSRQPQGRQRTRFRSRS